MLARLRLVPPGMKAAGKMCCLLNALVHKLSVAVEGTYVRTPYHGFSPYMLNVEHINMMIGYTRK